MNDFSNGAYNRIAITYDSDAFREHLLSVEGEVERDFLQSIQTGFFEGDAFPEAPYVPRLLSNDYSRHENVLSTL